MFETLFVIWFTSLILMNVWKTWQKVSDKARTDRLKKLRRRLGKWIGGF